MSGSLQRLAVTAGAGAVLGWWVVRSLVHRSRGFEFRGRVVVVAGGSRGLGLEIARQLVDAGAKVAICARTAADLESAAQELRARGGDVFSAPCDITQPTQARWFVERVSADWGRIDVLINVAGIIQVGPLDSMILDDFQQAMQINCFGPLHMILAVLPFMRRRGFGRIVNVASIGGKQAVPHLLPYDASKFALVGLSTGLRTELARENILVTTANPTLMRTGSPRNAIFKSRHREEYVTNLLNPAVMATQLAPTLTTEVLAIVNRFLPGFGGIGQQARWGYGSQSAVSPSVLTALADQAAKRNNQMRPRTA